jgi:hypothetical protein
MGSGIILPSLLTLTASAVETVIVADQYGGKTDVTIQSNGPWAPPQYSQPSLTIITVPAALDPSTGKPSKAVVNYVFDAVLKLIHRRRLHKTGHPVLTGANISDHAYIEPAEVTLDIGMSDAMASFTKGVWVGFSTKSISAWQVIKSLQLNKKLLTVTTRLDTYSNMLIIDAAANDDNRTQHGLRATITLSEIIAGSVSSQPSSSARPQASGNTQGGIIQSVPPNPSQTEQDVIPSALFPFAPMYPIIPGAGSVSSNSLSQIPGS